jgi:hypothetical protein
MQSSFKSKRPTGSADLTGKRFGSLVVLSYSGVRSTKRDWLCKCDCGKEVVRRGDCLQSGITTNCGCKTKPGPKTQNGEKISGTRLYNIWQAMKQRCTNPNSKDYKWYGGKGVSVCMAWLSDFLNFRAWAVSHGYAHNLEIDRIDSNGNYEPGNCRWVTHKENQANIARPFGYARKQKSGNVLA